jgi:ureidoacrylate peracid hydrolase
MIRPMVTIDARPEAVSIDPGRAAVLVVDMQNDFAAAGGMFHRAGIDISGIKAAASATPGLLSAAREAGIPIVYLRMEHEPDLSDIGPTDGPHWLKHSPDGVGDTVTAPDGSQHPCSWYVEQRDPRRVGARAGGSSRVETPVQRLLRNET